MGKETHNTVLLDATRLACEIAKERGKDAPEVVMMVRLLNALCYEHNLGQKVIEYLVAALPNGESIVDALIAEIDEEDEEEADQPGGDDAKTTE